MGGTPMPLKCANYDADTAASRHRSDRLRQPNGQGGGGGQRRQEAQPAKDGWISAALRQAKKEE